MKRFILGILLVLGALGFTGCNQANQGTVSVETKWGKIVKIHQPGDWYTTMSPGSQAYEADIKPWSDDITVHVGTKDNAGLKLNVKVIGRIKNDDTSIYNYLSKFGLDQKERHNRRWQIESGAVQTITRDAVALHDAYQIYKEQQTIQSDIYNRLVGVYGNELFAELISVQITDRPDFDNDDIENAASRVVAAQKEKEAQEQYKQAAQIELEKNEIVNRIYTSSPQAFELKKLEWQKYIAEAWAQNHAPIVFGGNTQIQVPTGR